ncbi:MAG TPA: UvrD-helicase domain-containing protein, partial [Burkholderiaceae bacterium]|nr:UvrD-helicase domain-containing protein [Burkholderiaceae bacterium]
MDCPPTLEGSSPQAPARHCQSAPTVPSYLHNLNCAQREAVLCGTKEDPAATTGPVLVIAGAGSGKTNTLAHRVAHLVAGGTDPGRVLLLTFTTRAAD